MILLSFNSLSIFSYILSIHLFSDIFELVNIC
nr:MAG TPA: hypothetical protein [Caudoviricetes sp.]